MAGKNVAPRKKQLQAHIVEDHNDALDFILRNIGSKSLNFSDNILLHFDAHPDLLTDKVYAKHIKEKSVLLHKVTIETWIIPLLFAGHFKMVIWIKPIWSTQIHVHDSTLFVGEHKETGKLRVFSELPYFIGSGSCSSLEDLINVKQISLHVAVIEASLSDVFKIVKLIEDNNENKYVLDIDLDFYSTKNPFLAVYDKIKMYEKLKPIYSFDCSDISNLAEKLQKRERQLKDLWAIFTHLSKPFTSVDTLEKTFEDCQLDELTLARVRALVTEFTETYDQVDWMLVHDAGTTIDDPRSELPHHVSTTEEIDEYFDQTKTFLDALPTNPALITIGRSSMDEYCPSDQVEQIQQKLVNYLETRYKAKINSNYI